MANDKLINDLSRIPNIIASLGLGIAEAQKQFNVDYIESLNAILKISSNLVGKGADPKGAEDLFRSLVLQIAPPRYQFTETELSVRLDLAESRSTAIQGAIGFAFTGVVVNASFALGFSSDFTAAAQVTTTIHSVLPGDNQAFFNALLDRARAIDAVPLTLPERSPLNQSLLDATSKLAQTIGAQIPIKPPATPAAPPVP